MPTFNRKKIIKDKETYIAPHSQKRIATQQFQALMSEEEETEEGGGKI